MDIINRETAERHDNHDPLKEYRRAFYHDENIIYLDGNSLGRLPLRSKDELEYQINERWGNQLIRSWNEDWYNKSSDIGRLIANLCGAGNDEIIVTDSTSVNLYKLAFAALKFQKGRTQIVTDEANFPSDVYILEGLASQFGENYEVVKVEMSNAFEENLKRIEQSVNANTALVSLSHVHFKSSYQYPMQQVNEIAHSNGALMLWDLSHSVGAVPVSLNETDADLAVGCTYKYLNGGPGSPAFLYVKKDLQNKLESPIWGWFGNQNPFNFSLSYEPAADIRKFLAGTPPILSLAPIKVSVEMIIEAGMDRIREKSIRQTEFLISLFDKKLVQLGFQLASPRDVSLRGSHISLKHPEAYRICKSLISKEIGKHVVIPDYRDPDIIRIGITPMYTTFIDIYQAVEEIEWIVKQNLFRKISDKRDAVT